MLTPKKFRINTENTIRTSPARAEVRSSWAALALLGSPVEVANWKPAIIIRMKAIPPAIPIPQRRMVLMKVVTLFTGIHPMAEFTEV